MGLLSYISTVPVAHTHSAFNKSIDVLERFGKNELYVNGIQQSGPYTIRLWKNGLKDIFDNPPKRINTILILGVGGGTVFPMLHDKFPDAHISAVDIDSAIIRMYSEYFSSGTGSYVSLVCADARKFIRTVRSTFDLIIVDVYIGNDVPDFVTGESFFRDLKNITSPHGTVVCNYFSETDQPKKFQIFFRKLSDMYRSVKIKPILRNQFYYCS